MECPKCEQLMHECRMNSRTIHRISTDNKALRAYVRELEEKIEDIKMIDGVFAKEDLK